jgi:hypothetical protein
MLAMNSHWGKQLVAETVRHLFVDPCQPCLRKGSLFVVSLECENGKGSLNRGLRESLNISRLIYLSKQPGRLL